MTCKWAKCIAILLMALGAVVLAPKAQAQDALRVLVTRLHGDDAASRAVQMRFFFEMIRAFNNANAAQRGAWVLYSNNTPERADHQAAVEDAMWPSVRADIVIWGRVVRLPDGYVVQPYISRTPLSYERDVQPDTLAFSFEGPGGVASYSLGNSSAFFELEPFTISVEVEQEFDDYQLGIPVYDQPNAQEPVDYTNAVVRFVEVRDDAVRVRYDGNKIGWLRYSGANERDTITTEFSHGLIHVLRGDWRNALSSFSVLLEQTDLTNALRLNALIYRGIAQEKLGRDGSEDFALAFALNDFDRNAARFHISSQFRSATERGTVAGMEEEWEHLRLLSKETDPMVRALGRAFFEVR